ERREEGVVARENQLDGVPQAHRRKLVALLPLRDDARFEPVEEVAFVGGQLRDGPDDLVESADVIEQRANGNQRAAEHQAGLNQVRPDDGLDSAERRIEAGDEGEGDDRDEIGTDRRDRLLAELHLSAGYEHAVRQHHHERGNEEPRSRRQRPHEQEEGGDVALGPRPEANAQVIVDRVNLEGVVGLEEDIADDDAPDDEAQHELHVGEALVGVALDGRAEEGRRAGFRRDDGRHRGPPRHATSSERIVIQALLPPPRIQPDGGDGDEIEEDDESVDQKPPVRGSLPSCDSGAPRTSLTLLFPDSVASAVEPEDSAKSRSLESIVRQDTLPSQTSRVQPSPTPIPARSRTAAISWRRGRVILGPCGARPRRPDRDRLCRAAFLSLVEGWLAPRAATDKGGERVRWAWTIVTMVALGGGWSAASGMDDRPVIDPGVRAVVSGGTLRVLVELRVPRRDPVALRNAQDEVLRRLAGTGGRLARRYATVPLLALEIDAAALVRLEEMPALVIRVRADDISPPYEGPAPSR